ncbi:MAG TPA: hypothetical protein PKH51_12650, partial [Candidatus Sumerlaeota bacterium]|nr:hypothetical protein [Candidatus Sumerlaeota bacterium]
FPLPHSPFPIPMPPFFNIPLDLPPPGTISVRIAQTMKHNGAFLIEDSDKMKTLVVTLVQMLAPYKEDGENPRQDKAIIARDNAAAIARQIVDEIERLGAQDDRVGQYVRNLFECFELGEEGAAISLRAGENPNSPQRPS